MVSRLGVYVRLPGVDVDAFANTMANNGLLGYVDTLSGGSISKVGPRTYFYGSSSSSKVDIKIGPCAKAE